MSNGISRYIYNDNCVWSFRWFPACCWPLVCCAVVCPSPPPPGSSLTGDRRDCGQTACPPRGTSCPTSAEPTSPGVSIHRQYAVGRGLGGWAGAPPGSLSMSTCSPHETIFFNLDIYYWVVLKTNEIACTYQSDAPFKPCMHRLYLKASIYC